MFARHNALETVRQQRFCFYTPLGKGLFHNRQGNELRCPRRHRRFNQGQAIRRHFLADGFYCRFQRAHFHLARSHIAEVVFGIIALDVHNHTVC